MAQATIESAQTLEVYPNPAMNEINISGLDTETIYDVIDINGQILNRKTTGNKLDISEIKSGVYLIRTEDGRTAKFIKL